jgi:hypothetical protein
MRPYLGLLLIFGLTACGNGSGCGDSSQAYPRDDLSATPSRRTMHLRINQTALDKLVAAAPGILLEECRKPDNQDCDVDDVTDPTAPQISFPLDGDDTFKAGSRFSIDAKSLEGNIQAELYTDDVGSGGGGLKITLGCDDETVRGCEAAGNDGSEHIKASIDAVFYPPGAACSVKDTASPGVTIKKIQVLFGPQVIVGQGGSPVLDVSDNAVEPTTTDWDFDITIEQEQGDPDCLQAPEILGITPCETACGLGGVLGDAAAFILNTQGLSDILIRQLVRIGVRQLADENLEVEGSVDLASLLPIINPDAQPTALLVGGTVSDPAGSNINPEVDATSGNKGWEFDFDGGFAAAHHPCVPTITPQSFSPGPVPRLKSVVYVVNPDTGAPGTEPVDLGLALADVFLERAAFEVFDGGSLCMSIDGDAMVDLTGGSFATTVNAVALLAPGLSELAPENAPVLLRVVPKLPPIISFGQGESVAGVKDSLIKLIWPSLSIELWPWVDDAWLSAITFAVDINLGLTVTPGPKGGIQMTIDSPPEDLVSNAVELYNEVGVAFDPEGISALLSSFLPLLLTGEPISTELTQEALGIPLVPKLRDAKRVGEEDDYVAIYLSFCTAENIADSADTLCYEAPATQGNSVGDAFSAEVIRAPEEDDNQSRAVIRALSTFENLEVAYRVGDGAWFSFQKPGADGLYDLRHPALARGGEHRLEVVGRDPRFPGRWSESVLLTVPGANWPPWIHAKRIDGGIRIWVGDDQSATETLKVSATIEGAFARSIAWGAHDFIEAQAFERVTLRVVDEHDAIGKIIVEPEGIALDLPAATDDLTDPPSQRSPEGSAGLWGCTATANVTLPGVIWLVLLFGFIRRRGLRHHF